MGSLYIRSFDFDSLPKSDCNLSNQTAISTIRLQSSQSMNRFYPVVHIGVHIPECVKHPAYCFRLQSPQSDCNISNHIAISAIRVQSPQSECNLSNQTAILLHCSLIVEIAVRLWRLQSDCKDCCQILEIEVWLCRLLSVCEDCSLIVEIAIWNEWNERFLNERLMSWIFQILSSQPIRGLNFGLSTNGKPLFQVLLFWLTSKIRLPSQQSDCNPAALQLEYRDWFGSQNRIAILYHATSLTRGGMTNRICKLRKLCNLSNPTAISAIQLQSQQSDCNPPELQLDYTDWFELQNRTAILDCSGLHLDYTDYPSIALDCLVLQSILWPCNPCNRGAIHCNPKRL